MDCSAPPARPCVFRRAGGNADLGVDADPGGRGPVALLVAKSMPPERPAVAQATRYSTKRVAVDHLLVGDAAPAQTGRTAFMMRRQPGQSQCSTWAPPWSAHPRQGRPSAAPVEGQQRVGLVIGQAPPFLVEQTGIRSSPATRADRVMATRHCRRPLVGDPDLAHASPNWSGKRPAKTFRPRAAAVLPGRRLGRHRSRVRGSCRSGRLASNGCSMQRRRASS